MNETAMRLCPACGREKLAQVFAPTGDAAEDLTVCIPCRQEARRAVSRDRVAREAGASMSSLTSRKHSKRIIPERPEIGGAA